MPVKENQKVEKSSAFEVQLKDNVFLIKEKFKQFTLGVNCIFFPCYAKGKSTKFCVRFF